MNPPRSGRILVWMRRAFRVDDNTPLLRALEEAEEVVPFVVLRDGSPTLEESPRRRFIRSAMVECDDQLSRRGSRLAVLTGNPVREIPAAMRLWGARAVYAVENVDPDSRARDRAIADSVRRAGGTFQTFSDRLIRKEGTLLTAAETPYRVFTPFRNAWIAGADEILPPIPPPRKIRTPKRLEGERAIRRMPGFSSIPPGEGERAALKRLDLFLDGPVFSYDRGRDFPGVEATSRLSPYLAHGALSPRRVYSALREGRHVHRGNVSGIASFLNELVWREFYYHLLHHYPFLIREEFREEFRGIRWRNDRRKFDAWREGRTGYPIVDAGMRQLAETGWMHNRARMIVASFLVKDLQCDWRMGEKHFFKYLIDGDLAVNNGGWQWVAGTGTDASPWFRVFNPTVQGKKFDPKGEYVRQFLPCLKGLPPRVIHTPWVAGGAAGYPPPIVAHDQARAQALLLYRRVR